MGRLNEAAADLEKALELNPDIWHGHVFVSRICIMQKRPQDALPEIGHIQEGDWRLIEYALAYWALGRKKEADTVLNELTAKYQAIDPYEIAEVYAFRNQPDKAFEWLDRAYAQHDPGLMETRVDPLLKNLHNDQRYVSLLRKLNLPT